MINEHNKQLLADISKLENIATSLSKQERQKIVNDLIENYFAVVGDYPSSDKLERLSNVLLVDEIKNRLKNKMRTAEYGFHSDRQLRTRRSKEIPLNAKTLDYLYQKITKRLPSLWATRRSNKDIRNYVGAGR